MANLKYKTRVNSDPKGKPRLYFCCSFEDFDKYFESVSDEILSKQNCTIWYTDEEIVRDEDFFADLKQMQLFVMPVTTSLLCTENEALNTEFKFAIENHIPVLPLMQESGLEELFNKKCGDLQFLDKNNTDTTAISYDEKLKKYLESVLIGDELAEKIRAAFDAYVFMSYRKKDRRYAQELMRLIHKNEFCRDIAIWYDEFLTPGENFNDSIKEALQKSGLFVLTVTPNLINEPNYIMTTEYPMARQEGKPILPAELVPTDREQLSEKYEDIPNPADAHNESELSEALLDSIKKMAIKENDKSPEHNYFIGLAYLSGIDVEVDYERAIELITNAAETGLLEAIDKLICIYETRANYSLAIKWREKKISILKGFYNKDRCFKSAENLINEIINCSESCSYIAYDGGYYFKKAIQLLSMAEKIMLDLYEYDGAKCLLFNVGSKIANIYTLLDMLEEAEVCYNIVYKRFNPIFCGLNKRMLLSFYTNMANCFALNGKENESVDICRKAFDLVFGIIETEFNISLIKQILHLATLFAKNKANNHSKMLYELIVKKYISILGVYNGDHERKLLSICYGCLGQVYIDENNMDKGLDFFEKALSIDKILFDKKRSIETILDLLASYKRCLRFQKSDVFSVNDYAISIERLENMISDIYLNNHESSTTRDKAAFTCQWLYSTYKLCGDSDKLLEYTRIYKNLRAVDEENNFKIQTKVDLRTLL